MADRFRIETEVSNKTLEKAKVELRETPENRAAGFKELRELLAQDNSIYYDTSDEILERYLRVCKWYAKSAYELMKREAAFKSDNKKILENLLPEKLEKYTKMKDEPPVNVLVNRDQDGRRILIQQAGSKWNTKDIGTDEIFQFFYLVHQAALLEPETQINGVVVILDFKGMGLSQVANLGVGFAKLLLTFIQEAMPLRLKQVHIVNEPFLFKGVWKLFSPFVKEKLNQRLWFHGSDMKKLHKYVDPNFLPADYAGALPQIDYSGREWYPTLASVTSVVEKNNTYGKKKN